MVILNPSGVLGPQDHRLSALGRAFRDLRDGRLPAVVSGCFDFVDARDVAAAALAAEVQGRSGENYLIRGHRITLPELMRRAATICGKRPPRWVVPLSLAKLAAPWLGGLARLRGQEPRFSRGSLRVLEDAPRLSGAKALRELGFSPRPLEASLRAVYASFRELGQ